MARLRLIHALPVWCMALVALVVPLLVHSMSTPTETIYALKYNIVGHDFYHMFAFENISDPSHGRVLYVDRRTAEARNLTFASGDTFILRADHTTTLVPGGPGRESVRIISRKTYTTHVSIYDIRHMPQGCGTWPAIRQKAPNWPIGGLIDILEGVNDQAPNSITLHTTTNCTMPPSRPMTGTAQQNDCDWTVNSNSGCGVRMAETPASYGPEFNRGDGGWYALERTNEHIKIWFWPRHGANVPLDVESCAPVVDPSKWGTPAAYFPNTQCDFEEHFKENNIIINLTLCGDWAGNVYPTSGCPGTCDEFVAEPANFVEAFFDFAAIRIYEQL